MLSTLDPSSKADWMADPKVSQAIHSDDLCRNLVDQMHDVMTARGITVADLARHLGLGEAAVRAAIVDPLQQPLASLARILSTLGLTLTPTQRA